MNDSSTAILIDSGTDVPPEYVKKYNMFVLPLIVQYKNASYQDGIDITGEEVYQRLPKEIPTTSLPNLETIKNTFQDIIAKGYKRVFAITISSGLSGTHNAMRLSAKEYIKNLETVMMDTKNISIGAGFTAILAGQLIEKGHSFNEIKDRLLKAIPNTKVFFCLNTLEYLVKGGRIGLVSSLLASALSIKPIISCNENGIYYTAAKTRGRINSIKKTLAMSINFAKDSTHYNIAVAHGNAKEECAKLSKQLRTLLPHAKMSFEGNISPSLAVHTGPGLIGICIQKLDGLL
jgi:DegV family protein with EDD domain